MLVVSDATPLNALIRLGHVEILEALYSQVVIPRAVVGELTHPKAPQEIRDWINRKPSWLVVRSPASVDATIASGAGECEAICLALEIGADYLLADDKEAPSVARRLGLRVIGTVGTLELAAASGKLDLRQALERLGGIGFFVGEEVLKQALARRARRLSNHHDAE